MIRIRFDHDPDGSYRVTRLVYGKESELAQNFEEEIAKKKKHKPRYRRRRKKKTEI